MTRQVKVGRSGAAPQVFVNKPKVYAIDEPMSQKPSAARSLAG